MSLVRYTKIDTKSPRNEYFDFSPDKATITKSAINSILIQFILKMKGIITMPIFTYFLLPKDMGVFNIISVTASLLAPLCTLNLPDGSVLFFAQEGSQEKIQKMYMTVIHSVALFSVVLGLAAYAFFALSRRELMPLAVWVGLILYTTVFYKLAEFLLVTFQKTAVVLKNALIRDLGTALLSVLLVSLGLSYRGLVISAAFCMVVMAGFLFRKIFQNLRYAFLIDWSELRKLLRISLPLLPVFFFSWIIQSSDSYFLLRFRGEAVVGKYGVVYGLCNTILILTFALNFFWFPVSAKLWARDRERYRKAFILIFSGFCLVLFLAVLLFELNSKLILRILARNAAYQDAYFIMGIIAFAFAMQVLITLLTAPLYSNRDSKLIFAAYFAGGLFNMILNILLIPKSGILGAAISTAMSYLLVVVLMSYFDYKVAKFPFLDRRLFPISLIFLILWAMMAFLRQSIGIAQVLVADVVLGLSVAGAIYFVVLRPHEKAWVRSSCRSLAAKRSRKE
jgi:O-antigen/teichoic acid export membrane protein